MYIVVLIMSIHALALGVIYRWHPPVISTFEFFGNKLNFPDFLRLERWFDVLVWLFGAYELVRISELNLGRIILSIFTFTLVCGVCVFGLVIGITGSLAVLSFMLITYAVAFIFQTLFNFSLNKPKQVKVEKVRIYITKTTKD